jgi:hypothetical protein
LVAAVVFHMHPYRFYLKFFWLQMNTIIFMRCIFPDLCVHGLIATIMKNDDFILRNSLCMFYLFFCIYI